MNGYGFGDGFKYDDENGKDLGDHDYGI